ncbi:MAG: hypothetical protein WCE57_08975 [Salegentibacter sp.]
MKIAAKYCLVFSFLFSTLFYNIRFSYLVIYHDLFNDSFTELYCVNKDKPELHCNGQCHMDMAAKDLNKKKKSAPALRNEITFFLSPLFSFKALLRPAAKIEGFFYSNTYAYHTSHREYPPPQALSLLS